MSALKIQKNKEKIVKLLNENIDLGLRQFISENPASFKTILILSLLNEIS